MIGRRLNLARVASGLSLDDLESKIGKCAKAREIGKYERNLSMPDSGILIALASALDVSEDYLLGDEQMVLDCVDYRKKRISSKQEEARVEAQALYLIERYQVVEEVLNLPSVEWDRPNGIPWPVMNGFEEVEQAAAEMRNHWNLGIDPIANLVELLEERGVKVLDMDLRDIDGLAAQVHPVRGGSVPIIVVNRNDSGERQRFTLAHELGHLVMDVAEELDAEKIAQRFAGAFLMPADALWHEIGKCRASISIMELVHLKKLFGVSIQAIAHRCKDLDIFRKELFKSLFREFHQFGWIGPPYTEPASRAKEVPERFERLTLRALSEDAVSESKAAELLGVSIRELDAVMDAREECKSEAK